MTASDKVRAAAGRRLGVALAPVVSTLNLGEVVVSGPPELLDAGFRKAARDTIRERTLRSVGDNVDVTLSSLGEDDVHLGAARLVLVPAEQRERQRARHGQCRDGSDDLCGRHCQPRWHVYGVNRHHVDDGRRWHF